MRSPVFAAIIGISFVSACGGSGYGGYDDDDDQDKQTDKVEARDAGAWDARAKDAGKTGWSDAGGGGSGSGGDNDSDDDDDDDDDDGNEVSADAGVGADAGGSSGGAVDCATLTYQTFGKQFLSNYCVSCHSGSNPSGQVNLTSLANVVRSKTGVKAQVTSGGMPLGGKQPSAAERKQLGDWIDCGPK